MTDTILSVAEYNQLLSVHLSDLGELVVEGEISQPQISQGKWFFCTLKDASSSMSVFAPIWKISNAQTLTDGMLVKVFGTVGVHQKSGRLSFTAYSIEPSGEGALRRAYELLKKQLAAEGLFDPARKRPLPLFPQTIGLITASGSRALADFMRVLGDQMGGLSIQFYPVQVQGRVAVDSICQAFSQINTAANPPEVVVLTRGGGSLEDLLSFNDERVARAVFSCKVPVVSAIGHELDQALTDFVADVRAATPTHAAEILVLDKKQVNQQATHMMSVISGTYTRELRDQLQLSQSYSSLLEAWFDRMKQQLLQPSGRLGVLLARFHQSLPNELNLCLGLTLRLHNSFQSNIKLQQSKINKLSQLLLALDPMAILRRGYSLVRTADGQIVRSATQVKAGEMIWIQLPVDKMEAVKI